MPNDDADRVTTHGMLTHGFDKQFDGKALFWLELYVIPLFNRPHISNVTVQLANAFIPQLTVSLASNDESYPSFSWNIIINENSL